MRLQRSVGPDDQEKANAAVEAQADEAPIEDTAPALDAETRSHKYLTHVLSDLFLSPIHTIDNLQ